MFQIMENALCTSHAWRSHTHTRRNMRIFHTIHICNQLNGERKLLKAKYTYTVYSLHHICAHVPAGLRSCAVTFNIIWLLRGRPCVQWTYYQVILVRGKHMHRSRWRVLGATNCKRRKTLHPRCAPIEWKPVVKFTRLREHLQDFQFNH